MTARAQTRLTATDRREQILEVASRLFAKQGFQGTTTRQIAEEAGVNEALIFRHFPTKEELYWGVLDAQLQSARAKSDWSKKIESSRDVREMFTAIAEDMLNRDVTLSRLLWFSALENHKLAGRFFESYIAKYYEQLAEQIRERQQRGEFRDVDPLLAARGFIGMAAYHFLIQELFGAKRYQKFDTKKVSEELTDIWLSGVSKKMTNGGGSGASK